MLKEISHEMVYLFQFCTSLLSLFIHLPSYSYSSTSNSILNNNILSFNGRPSKLLTDNKRSNYYNDDNDMNKNNISNHLSDNNYCIFPRNQFIIGDIIDNTNLLKEEGNVCDNLQFKSQTQSNSNSISSEKEMMKQLLDFSDVFKKLDNLHSTLNQINRNHESLYKHIKNTKNSHQIIHHTLEGYSLEIYNLYNKINQSEEQLIHTIQSKSNAIDFQYQKNVERDERILKILYNHMTQLYDTQIDIIDQVNSLFTLVENNLDNSSSQFLNLSNNSNNNNNNNNNNNHYDQLFIQGFMKRKYIVLRQEMNKYKMMLTIFELPLNLLVQNDSFPYFEDFLQYIQRESKTFAQYTDILKLNQYSSLENENDKLCKFENPLWNTKNNEEICKEDYHQKSRFLNTNELNIIYELYQIYHERFLKLKQKNIKKNQTNESLFQELNHMTKQIENVHTIIKMLNMNQEKLENKFKSIEQLMINGNLSSLQQTSSNANQYIQPQFTSHKNKNKYEDWICSYIPSNFYADSSLDNPVPTINSLDQCPIFHNEFIDLVYQYVIKKIHESDHGVSQPDYALKSSGGYVIHSLTSPSYTGEIHYEDQIINDMDTNKDNTNNKQKNTNTILNQRYHHDHHSNEANSSFLKILLSKYILNNISYFLNPSADLVIDPHILPGYGWAMKGSSGYITIGLAKPIYPKSFTIDHIPFNLNLEDSLASAPRYIEVIGIYDLQKYKMNQRQSNNNNNNNNSKNENKNNKKNKIKILNNNGKRKGKGKGKEKEEEEEVKETNNEIILIPVFEFDPLHTTSLSVPVSKDIYIHIKKPISFIQIKILSNWGNSDYTYIYRLRIH